MRQHCGLYAHFHLAKITHVEVAVFLRELLRHLAGPNIVVWDGGAIHRGAAVRQLLPRHPRLQVERFPAYAPELNQDELVWNYLKSGLANGRPDTIGEFLTDLTRVTRRLRRSPRSCARSSSAQLSQCFFDLASLLLLLLIQW